MAEEAHGPSESPADPAGGVQAAGAQPLNQSEVAEMAGVTVSAFTPTTLQFAWGSSTPGSFPDQASANEAFKSVLAQASALHVDTPPLKPRILHPGTSSLPKPGRVLVPSPQAWPGGCTA